uniref:Uncharacterized protein n=1 Tax=Anguilla anguilla TaxID=7936 RepID=A0A0E9URD7_ANGAN
MTVMNVQNAELTLHLKTRTEFLGIYGDLH